MSRPLIFIFTGTGGAGRKTTAHRIGQELGIEHVLSTTTRLPREKEYPDKDYHYVSPAAFEQMQEQQLLIENVRIGPVWYGIRYQELNSKLRSGKHVYLILNSEGASVFKKLYPEQVVRIFLYVSKPAVRERLEAKGRPDAVIEQYLDLYTEEVVYRTQCEHVIENMDLNRTLDKIREAIQSHL
ncbi:guanylate kinase [Paenibacillus pinihumi]|uniref:guanylate kinase n=1 Tax=Paenibacillus pinihumi TaxID=669462 RepID=UPI000406A5FA|nr:guanylate kinase [Paenibacillus pinihumi]